MDARDEELFKRLRDQSLSHLPEEERLRRSVVREEDVTNPARAIGSPLNPYGELGAVMLESSDRQGMFDNPGSSRE